MASLLDRDRLWHSLEAVSSFGGAAEGGLHRLAASTEDGLARDYVVAEAMALGCTRRVDNLGNVFLRLAGTDPTARAILVGSHLDSQPHAGRYDGTYGVIAGLEVLRVLHNNRPRRSIELVCWTGEEGARFRPAMLGSSGFAGLIDAAELLSTRDEAGIALAEALAAIGYAGTDDVSPEEFIAYLEAHIEQGPVLERLGRSVGVVDRVQAQHWWEVIVRGRRGHTGTCPMEDRADALVAAAQLVAGVRQIGLAWPGTGRATVGHLSVTPNSPNVIPGEVRLTVEFRHPEHAVVITMARRLKALAREAAAALNVQIATSQLLASPPIIFDPKVVAAIDEAASSVGLAALPMVSGAGHDACPISRVLPSAMLFIPCRDGVSHAPEEAITPAWAEAGARVLLASIRRLDTAVAADGSR